jgi:hypothetical protein
MTLIEIWNTCRPESWEYTPQAVRKLWVDKQVYRSEVNGDFCYISDTVNPETAPLGFMRQVWGATKWRFIELGETNA